MSCPTSRVTVAGLRPNRRPSSTREIPGCSRISCRIADRLIRSRISGRPACIHRLPCFIFILKEYEMVKGVWKPVEGDGCLDTGLWEPGASGRPPSWMAGGAFALTFRGRAYRCSSGADVWIRSARKRGEALALDRSRGHGMERSVFRKGRIRPSGRMGKPGGRPLRSRDRKATVSSRVLRFGLEGDLNRLGPDDQVGAQHALHDRGDHRHGVDDRDRDPIPLVDR